MSSPFSIPTKAPTSNDAKMAQKVLAPRENAIDAITPASAALDETDRSNPPAIRRITIPTATVALTESAKKSAVRLAEL